MKKTEPAWLDELPEAFKVYRAGREVDEVECEEMRLFHREISPWEREHQFLNV